MIVPQKSTQPVATSHWLAVVCFSDPMEQQHGARLNRSHRLAPVVALRSQTRAYHRPAPWSAAPAPQPAARWSDQHAAHTDGRERSLHLAAGSRQNRVTSRHPPTNIGGIRCSPAWNMTSPATHAAGADLIEIGDDQNAFIADTPNGFGRIATSFLEYKDRRRQRLLRQS
jgi:hypothetical protein